MKQFKGDKRTKEYKEWKANFDNKSKGLGDTVEKITEVTGIKNVVKSVLGDDCGCDDRKEKLNKFMRYKIVNCLSENDYNFLKNVIEKGGKIKPETQIKMKAIFENTFNKKLTSNCLSCSFVSEIYRPLRNLIEKYD